MDRKLVRSAMVDRTAYPDTVVVPDSALRQVFGRQRLPEKLCILAAEIGLINVETFAMLGDTIVGVKTTLKTLVEDVTKLGDTGASQELSLTSLAAVWKTCSSLQEHFAARRAKMEEDPSKVPEIPGACRVPGAVCGSPSGCDLTTPSGTTSQVR